MGILTEVDLALLQEAQLAHVATIEPDGTPHVTPVWVDTDGEHIVFNTVRGRKKHANMLRNPVVAVSIADKADDMRTLWVKGTVEMTEEGADQHINKMAKKYLGQESYPFGQPGDVRVIVKIKPTQKLGRG
ncbi:PPOX class probable F420-dependent enzyme [Micromonospora pattaloongensis]|uniref:PPOX class probable F420-dependent enzyme n=1 Tax=Micromonospora pattaloongensis TaxID=405436 RepID=A0A1H3SML0_9ACTN|nr:PPOX class F420-dependent oxidoreductase [Micromonospora pattaloongensis]SDZ38805.1 PPOX class probable F420-dependent enzyme [Micromonospora pattaloongensis]